ncbi:MAG: hypothetical protein WC717_00555 [Candidatus Micrarchaeia archaeon]|jgi:hypothetical protein
MNTGTTKYAEKIMALLNCREKAAGLNGEYLKYLSEAGMQPGNPSQTIRSIRRFLRIKKQWNVDMFGPKTTKYGSTCLESGVAAVLLAGMNEVDARLVFIVNHRPIPIHYNVVFEADGRQVGMEIMFRKWKPEDTRVRYRKELSPESAAMHAKYVGIPFKVIGLRRMVKAARQVRKQIRAASWRRAIAQPR